MQEVSMEDHRETSVYRIKVPEIFMDDGTKGAGRNWRGDEWSPRMALEDTVRRMQRDWEDLQAENRFLKTPTAQTVAPITR